MLRKFKNCLLIHHWDADGVCSAAQIYEELSSNNTKIELYVPVIGSYRLNKGEMERFKWKSYECIVIADISLPEQDILELKKLTGSLFIFDHHVQRQIPNVQIFNPILSGRMDYPSTSWIVKDYFGMKTDLLAVLGAIGDHEESVKEFKIYSEINEFLRSSDLTLSDALHMVELIDSNYKVKDRLAVREAVLKLIEYKDRPRRILEDRNWIERAEIIRREVERCLQTPVRVYNKIILKDIDSKFNIISTVTRRISWSNPGRVTVVVNRNFGEDSQIYVRENGLNVDLTGIIEMAKSKGYVAGGRRNSVGILLPRSHVEPFLSDIESYLEGLV